MDDFNCSLTERLRDWVSALKENSDLVDPVPSLSFALFPGKPGPSIGILGCFERTNVPGREDSGFVTIDGVEFLYKGRRILNELNGKTIDINDGRSEIY